MHRAFLRAVILFGLLAVMAAAGGCVALYTLSRAADQPDDTGGGVGIPLFPPGTAAPSAATTPAVATPSAGGDGVPFEPYVTGTAPPIPFPGMETPAGAARPSPAAIPSGILRPTETPPMGGPPPHDEIPRPSLPATPL